MIINRIYETYHIFHFSSWRVWLTGSYEYMDEHLCQHTVNDDFRFVIPTCNGEKNKITVIIWYRGADKSLARPTSRCILFDGENISFDASLVI